MLRNKFTSQREIIIFIGYVPENGSELSNLWRKVQEVR